LSIIGSFVTQSIMPPVALQPNARHGLLILEVSRSTQRCITVGRTHLDEWSARRTDLYLTTHIHNRETSMPPASGRRPTS